MLLPRCRLQGPWRYGLANVSRRPAASVAQIASLGLGLMVLLYVELEPEIQVTFLDALGVEHTNGSIPEGLEPPFADAVRIREAATALVGTFGDNAQRYLRTIAMYNAEAWPGLTDVVAGWDT